jgi:cytoskeletal protein RodZ
MESVGARIKKIRLEKGISLEEVYKKTKIHLNVLKAIEEDSPINFNPVYIKGFLKIYCKFLGIEPKDYITDYKEPRTKFAPIWETKQRAISPLKIASLKFAYFKSRHIKIIKKVLSVVLIVIFVIGLFNLGRIISSRRTPATLRKQTKLAAVTSSTKEKRMETAKSPQGQPAMSIQRLTIRAKENCWIQVKIDGRVVFQNILIKGRSETWQAKNRIELSLGNAGVVDLEANGKFISNLGKRGQPLKNILISKEGLSIVR